jgi:hypothetical protein
MKTYYKTLKKYLDGKTITKKEINEIANLSKTAPGITERESARVLHLCLTGNTLHDQHTRTLATKRTRKILLKLIETPPVGLFHSPSVESQ